MGEINNDRRKKRKVAALIVGVVLLLCLVAAIFIYNNVITAVTMRIQRLVGTVNLYNDAGTEQSLREKMRLGEGQTVTTAGQSLIMVSLDDTKMLTMEESSRADIKARGKKLMFDLVEGNLFFNVTEKLKENEEFEIHTSTMICGIRGTSAYIGKDLTGHDIIMVTDGVVHVIATNPVTKESIEADVTSGQMRTIYLDEEAAGSATISMKRQTFREEDLPPMALDTIRKNPQLMDRVSKATGVSREKLTALADLSSTAGVSMYGSAIDDLRDAGIEDSIPYMGNRANEMVNSANSAADIAKDDLPLEVAIITGYRGVMDVGTSAGYEGDTLGLLMQSTRSGMEETLAGADEAGLDSEEKIKVAMSYSDTLLASTDSMTGSNLSTGDISQVTKASTKLYTDAIGEHAKTDSGTSSDDIWVTLATISGHVTNTVDDEMKKSSDGNTTAAAILGREFKSNPQKAAGDSTQSQNRPKHHMDDTSLTADTTEKTNIAPVTGSALYSGPSSAVASGSSAASSQDIKNARASIIFTDPATGIIALADGNFFDPAYYAAANPDVVAKYGTSAEALLAEWLKEGKSQGRPPVAPRPSPTPTPVPEWVWLANNSNNNDGPDPYAEEEEEPEPTPTPTAAPTASPTPPSPYTASTGTYDSNSNEITVGNTMVGAVKAATGNTAAKLYPASTQAGNPNITIELPLSVKENNNEVYRFNTLLDVDWFPTGGSNNGYYTYVKDTVNDITVYRSSGVAFTITTSNNTINATDAGLSGTLTTIYNNLP